MMQTNFCIPLLQNIQKIQRSDSLVVFLSGEATRIKDAFRNLSITYGQGFIQAILMSSRRHNELDLQIEF